MDFLHDAWVMDAQEINYRTVSFLGFRQLIRFCCICSMRGKPPRCNP
jgi:hypothetical protein